MAIGTGILRRILGGSEQTVQPQPLSEGDRSAALERLRWFGTAAAACEHAAGSGRRISMWPR